MVGIRLPIFSIIAGLIFALTSCDAPRNNPLDPDNPRKPYGYIYGTIYSRTAPPAPLTAVNVYWEPGNIIIQTDAKGAFTINEIRKKDGWLYLSKNGFYNDSVFVDWHDTQAIEVTNYMSAQPLLIDLSIYSSVLNKYADVQTFKIHVEAAIIDIEQSIDTVFIKYDTLKTTRRLSYNVNDRQWIRTLSMSDLQLTSIDQVIGKEFDLIIVDKNNKRATLGTSNVKRIIKQEIDFESPANLEEVGNNPTLRWKRFTPGFGFTYTVEIYTNEIAPSLVYQKNKISSNDISFDVPVSLSSGEYFWVIWCIDEFKNRTRSKPATFLVN